MLRWWGRVLRLTPNRPGVIWHRVGRGPVDDPLEQAREGTRGEEPEIEIAHLEGQAGRGRQETADVLGSLLSLAGVGAHPGLVAFEGSAMISVRSHQLSRQDVSPDDCQWRALASQCSAVGGVADQGNPPAREGLRVRAGDGVEKRRRGRGLFRISSSKRGTSQPTSLHARSTKRSMPARSSLSLVGLPRKQKSARASRGSRDEDIDTPRPGTL